MAEGRIKNTELAAIAAAIRSKNGESTVYKPSEMAAAIAEIPSGAVIESKSITQNGTYTAPSGVDGYSPVVVDVPNSYAAADEGKVVSNGALVAQTARSSQITQNGTYDTTNNNSVTVNVSGGGVAFVKLMNQGQVSTTSNYATAYFDSDKLPVGYNTFRVDLWRDGSIVCRNLLYTESLPVSFSITGGGYTYTMQLTSTSINCSHYGGSYVNLYVDVYATNLSLS